MSGYLALALSLACLLSACVAGAGSTSPESLAPPPAAIHVYAGTVERNMSVASQITGITYPFHVYLPEGYASSGRSYPVIYATDGQWSFGAFSRMLDKRRKAWILISIEQGGQDRREVDYTVDGAPAYGRFLREELAPLVEARYRTAGPRTFAGTSYGGLLGAILLSKEDVAKPFFSNYLLFDGAFWALTPANIKDEELRFAASPRLPVKLILTTASAPGNVNEVITYEARYKSRAYVNLVIQRKDFNVAHNDVGRPSFDWAIDLID
jgi:predicted alpha/beta superfamily hydrolase